ncbi:MAG TPA: response regulator transcription factor [Cyclobacteriaceae bacterium]|nr:response regulator transcription factor [Cyclobacteriaceae bacterium]
MSAIKIYLLDDHQIVIDGIKLMLENTPGMQLVGENINSEKALAELGAAKPDVLICDINMPGITGIELSKIVKKAHPEINILILTMIDSVHTLNELLDSGVKGYVLKNKGREELITAIQAVATGNNFFSAEIMRQVLTAAKNIDKPDKLTAREIEIIKLLARGLSSSEIADQLFISNNTVETHRRNIMRKTNTHTTVELINYSKSNHIIN